MKFNLSNKIGRKTSANALADGVKEAYTDGVWSWFTDPMVYVAFGYTWVGSAGQGGNVSVTKIETNGTASTFTLSTLFETDDHNQPAFLELPNGTLAAFYSDHATTNGTTRLRICTNVSDITNASNWTTEIELPNSVGWRSTYANPFLFSDNKVRLIRREGSATLGYRIVMLTCNLAEIQTPASWTIQVIFTGAGGTDRPYVRWTTNEGQADRIDIFCTNGHPSASTTGLYHCSLRLVGGVIKYYKTDGVEITTALPHAVDTRLTVIEPPTVDHWVWDIKANGNDIRCLGQKSPNNNAFNHEYYHYKWNGSEWIRTTLFDPAFEWPLYIAEGFYTGGMCFDSSNWDILFIARPNANVAVDLAEYHLNPLTGQLRKLADIAYNSANNLYNCRPNSPTRWQGGHPRVVWWRGRYTTYTDFLTSIMTWK